MTNNDELAMSPDEAAEFLRFRLEKRSEEFTFVYSKHILALLAERDADKKRIAELEARTVSLTIKPPTIGRAYSALANVWTVQEVREACAAAGIKLEVGE